MKFNLEGKVAVITGAGGAICGEIAKSFAKEGIAVALWDISLDKANKKLQEIKSHKKIAVKCDVTDRESIIKATDITIKKFKTIDILVNGAGGSRKQTTTSEELQFFDIQTKEMEKTIQLNYLSAVIPSQIIGKIFAENKKGVIINISSIAGIAPLTRALTYSDSKAACNSFTRWLAVHMAVNYSPNIRVNAIAPGFMLTEQNRFLLIDEKTGKITKRGNNILKNVPMKRYGQPDEIVGASLWLSSDSASFVTGTVIPIDGGFTAFSGV